MGDEHEFSPEQRLVIEIMRYFGTPNPEAVVRANRLTAYRLGADLAPLMAGYARAAAKVLDAYIAAIGHPNPNTPPAPAAP